MTSNSNTAISQHRMNQRRVINAIETAHYEKLKNANEPAKPREFPIHAAVTMHPIGDSIIVPVKGQKFTYKDDAGHYVKPRFNKDGHVQFFQRISIN